MSIENPLVFFLRTEFFRAEVSGCQRNQIWVMSLMVFWAASIAASTASESLGLTSFMYFARTVLLNCSSIIVGMATAPAGCLSLYDSLMVAGSTPAATRSALASLRSAMVVKCSAHLKPS